MVSAWHVYAKCVSVCVAPDKLIDYKFPPDNWQSIVVDALKRNLYIVVDAFIFSIDEKEKLFQYMEFHQT